MNKNKNRCGKLTSSFTIIELLISIALTGLILAYLYSSVSSIKTSNDFYEKKIDKFDRENQLAFLLYQDILLSVGASEQAIKKDHNQSKKTEKKDKRDEKESELGKPEFEEQDYITQFFLKSKHSVKGYIQPYVTYVFYRKHKVLYRIESKERHKVPFDENLIAFTRYNRFNNVDEFFVHRSGKDYLVFYSLEDKPQFFEVSKL